MIEAPPLKNTNVGMAPLKGFSLNDSPKVHQSMAFCMYEERFHNKFYSTVGMYRHAGFMCQEEQKRR